MRKFRQPPEVRNVLNQHLDRHHAGQRRVLMLNARGDLLILERSATYNPRTRQRCMTVTGASVVPVTQSWKPALVSHGYLAAPKKAA